MATLNFIGIPSVALQASEFGYLFRLDNEILSIREYISQLHHISVVLSISESLSLRKDAGHKAFLSRSGGSQHSVSLGDADNSDFNFSGPNSSHVHSHSKTE